MRNSGRRRSSDRNSRASTAANKRVGAIRTRPTLSRCVRGKWKNTGRGMKENDAPRTAQEQITDETDDRTGFTCYAISLRSHRVTRRHWRDIIIILITIIIYGAGRYLYESGERQRKNKIKKNRRCRNFCTRPWESAREGSRSAGGGSTV